MSYIRCLSNPEGLYIFNSGSKIEIYGNDNPDGGWTCAPKYISPTILHGLLRRWLKNFDDCTFKGASLKYNKWENSEDFKWRLTFKDWGEEHLDMWETTLYYLAKINEHRWSKT